MSQQAIDALIALRRSAAPKITPDKACLLVVDMQDYQVRRDGAIARNVQLGSPGLLDYFVAEVEHRVEPNIARLLEACRQCGMQVAYTKFASFQEDGRDLHPKVRQMNSQARRTIGEPVFPYQHDSAAQIVKALEPQSDELIVVKNTSAVFTATNLDTLLRNMGIEQLLVCGVVTNMCVEGSARIGADLGYEVFIIDDGCAAWSREVHDATLRSFEMIFGHVLTTDTAIAEIQERR